MPNHRVSRSKNAVTNVRVMDPYSGTNGARVDRLMSSIQNSGNHIMVLCGETNGLTISTTADLTGNIGWSQIRVFDDFTSIAGQFNTFRIKSIRYDVYDINPAVPNSGTFGTFHDQYTIGTQPNYSFGEVVDSIDSQMVPPGTGKVSFTWVAHTPLERGYVDVTPDPVASGPDFGGLRYIVPQGGSSQTKYRVITKAVVEFRGRR